MGRGSPVGILLENMCCLGSMAGFLWQFKYLHVSVVWFGGNCKVFSLEKQQYTRGTMVPHKIWWRCQTWLTYRRSIFGLLPVAASHIQNGCVRVTAVESTTCAHIACSFGAMERTGSSQSGTSLMLGVGSIHFLFYVQMFRRYGFQWSTVATQMLITGGRCIYTSNPADPCTIHPYHFL